MGFLLLDNFTMIALASAVEPLRMANQLSGEELYSWHMISENGEQVRASDGLCFTPDASISHAPDVDILIVAGGVNITRSYRPKQISWIQAQARRGIVIGGICTGPYALAHAGLLDDHECSAHWECIAALQERYPKVRCNNRLFTIDQKRMTSSGAIRRWICSCTWCHYSTAPSFPVPFQTCLSATVSAVNLTSSVFRCVSYTTTASLSRNW
ncbi:AraC family transcriptional regulator [Aliamphritea spongicola]